MKKIPHSLLSLTALFLHVLAMPVFFLGFILIYESQWINTFLETGLGVIFNTLMLTSILIGVTAASRIAMTLRGKEIRISWWKYTIWSFGEIESVHFSSLYLYFSRQSD